MACQQGTCAEGENGGRRCWTRTSLWQRHQLSTVLWYLRKAETLLTSNLQHPQVNFNEPLSMLQRLTEDLEYHHLLDKAVNCTSSVEQMCLVAAFSVSSYSTTVHRIAKPFNPMLGETFELDRLEDMGLRSLCEQVRSAIHLAG